METVDSLIHENSSCLRLIEVLGNLWSLLWSCQKSCTHVDWQQVLQILFLASWALFCQHLVGCSFPRISLERLPPSWGCPVHLFHRWGYRRPLALNFPGLSEIPPSGGYNVQEWNSRHTAAQWSRPQFLQVSPLAGQVGPLWTSPHDPQHPDPTFPCDLAFEVLNRRREWWRLSCDWLLLFPLTMDTDEFTDVSCSSASVTLTVSSPSKISCARARLRFFSFKRSLRASSCDVQKTNFSSMCESIALCLHSSQKSSPKSHSPDSSTTSEWKSRTDWWCFYLSW